MAPLKAIEICEIYYFVHLNCNANLFFGWKQQKINYRISGVKIYFKKNHQLILKIFKKRYATNNQMKLHLRFLRILTKLRNLKILIQATHLSVIYLFRLVMIEFILKNFFFWDFNQIFAEYISYNLNKRIYLFLLFAK